MKQFRRKIDGILSEGQGRQLVLMALVALGVLAVLLGFGWAFGMRWEDVLAIYLDPGVYGGAGANNWFRIIVAVLGLFLLSGLLVSVFINLIGNVSGAYERGDKRYRFSDHILIIGSSRSLAGMLQAIRNHPDLSRKDILILTKSEVAPLRSAIQASLGDRRFCSHISFYHCDRESQPDLAAACPDKAKLIYLIGEDNEAGHDARNIKCLAQLRDLCPSPGPVIQCFVTLENHSSMDVIRYMKGNDPSRLSVDVINESDYVVEQVLVHSDLLPARTPSGQQKGLRIVITGDSAVARSFAVVASQICHYPRFKDPCQRTHFVFLGAEMRYTMDAFVASHSALFDLCHYRYVSPGTTEAFSPKAEYGDFMDMDWTFIDADPSTPYARSQMEEWASEPAEDLVVALCSDRDELNFSTAVHLPRSVYESGSPVLVYQGGDPTLVTEAGKTGLFGRLVPFGPSMPGVDALFLRRTAYGKRVNRVYDREYGNPPAPDADAAWKDLPQAHKLSSIASSNFLPMILRCFHLDPTPEVFSALTDDQLEVIAEMEHRRWIASVLMLGYAPAAKNQRKDRSRFKELKEEKFIHLDIAPYEELTHDREKDRLIISNIPYILTGNQ